MPIASWILVLGDEHSVFRAFERELEAVARPRHAASFEEALMAMRTRSGMLAAVLDVDLPDGRWGEVLREIRAIDGEVPVLVTTRGIDRSVANEAQRMGAEFTFKPLGRANLRSFLDRALRARCHSALRRWLVTGALGPA